VVDPGQEAVGPLEALLAEHRLTPVAVLLTHGHSTHVSVAPVATATTCRRSSTPTTGRCSPIR
jgi:glyoxylase-like metal-dependent hydrolase (beta-lactamase superfamily II)